MTSRHTWKDCVAPYMHGITLSNLSSDSSEKVPISEASDSFSHKLRVKCLGDIVDAQEEENDEGSNLCNIEFSLAFGGKILLHNTYLKLGRGRRYGVMGKNGAGKTTLLKNIGTGNIEGLPSSIKTVYVQHDDASDDNGQAVIEELLDTDEMKKAEVTKEMATKALADINFTEEMLNSPRSCLSGGWKMKLLIIKAILLRADVLLLDVSAQYVQYLKTELISLVTITRYTRTHSIGTHQSLGYCIGRVACKLLTLKPYHHLPDRISRHEVLGPSSN